MICVVIKGPTFQEVYQQIVQAIACADLVELRLDYLTSLDLISLENIRSAFSIPMIFTLRSELEGGCYKGSEENRLALLRQIVQLQPDYLDLESHIPLPLIEEIIGECPNTKLILSYHNFEMTPDLDKIYNQMQRVPAHFYKIAVHAENCLDALKLLCWAKNRNVIAISMGQHGQLTRILAPILGSPITYAALEENREIVPGQLTAKLLIEKYHHLSLNPQTAIYGLIGDPVNQSISDETHNYLMTEQALDAVYVKIQVKPSELPEFLSLAKRLSFSGFSVTRPLKEAILPFLDSIDPSALEIGAVNTLLLKEGKIYGFNTDGLGALNVIENEFLVKDRKILIIGAGGAAKAIAYEAAQRGALVTVINRDSKKAIQIAERLKAIGRGLEQIQSAVDAGYDLLINCTPLAMPLAPEHMISRSVVMDIVTKPKETDFLKLAKQKQCRLIYGYQMFVQQALGQFAIWFDQRVDTKKAKVTLEKKAQECV
jgi:3-dehydroquinate dehydratase / shikimate dehydrogenase